MTREEIIKELSEMRTDAWTDTRQMEALAEGIKALKQEPCDDAISRQAVLDELNKWDWQELYLPIHFKENIIDVVPFVNPQEPKTGHWTHDGSHWKYRFLCSECNYKLFEEPSNFCPNCGARMVGDADEKN